MLQLCVSQQHNHIPFSFKSTGIRVFSFEEALYHVFHYWRESVDDFLSEEFVGWVSEIGLSFIGARVKDLLNEKSFTSQLLGFLQLVDYFSPMEISALKATLQAWETRREWERLKERADYLVERGEPAKALPLYKRALQFEENAELLNNIAVASMQLFATGQGASYLARAHALQPSNITILLHYIEAAILDGQYKTANHVLQTAEEATPNCADIPYLYGLIAFQQKSYATALNYYKRAADLAPQDPYYIYKIAGVHKAMRQYHHALAILETIPNKDANYYVNEAEIHAQAQDIPAAIKCMRRATSAGGINDAAIWAKLAEYHRQDYDWPNAQAAIRQALHLAPENDKVRLENARIKKGTGQTRDYQNELSGVLKSLKDRYRGGD